jgi:putative tryptophan/tyrosine transport system substrate-binding protein
MGFFFDEYGSPSAVNNTYSKCSVRDKSSGRTRCAMKKSAASSVLVGVILIIVAAIAEAQQAKKIPRIGYLNTGSAGGNFEAFRKGLRNLGYIEGKNIEILDRAADGKSERLPDLAAELVRLQVAVIVTSGTAAAKAAKQATTVIPIVVGSAGDLVGDEVVASLAHPGGNVSCQKSTAVDLRRAKLD